MLMAETQHIGIIIHVAIICAKCTLNILEIFNKIKNLIRVNGTTTKLVVMR